MRLIRLPGVDADIIALSSYIAQNDAAAAEQFQRACKTTFARLAETPHIGVERIFGEAELASLRMWFVEGFEKHLIFYRVLDDAVEIVRVLHAARDLNDALGH